MVRRRSSTNVLVLTRGVSAGRATAAAVTSPIPGLIWRVFSMRSCKHFMKAETSADCGPTSPPKGGIWWDEEGCGELNGHPLRSAPIGLS